MTSIIFSLTLCGILLGSGSTMQQQELAKRNDDLQGWETVVQTLSQKVDQLQAKVQALENAQNADTAISFFVQFTEYHHHFLHDNDILKFDHVISNVGNAYTALMGHFVAPKAGTYAFSVNLLSDHDHSVWQNICIMKNSDCAALTQLANAASMSVVLELNSGDSVWVMKRDGPGTSIYGINHSTFSGFLVAAT